MNRTVGKTLEDEATQLWRAGFDLQETGDLEGAKQLYRRSIAVRPSAEAHTHLGWAQSFQGNYEEAIRECVRAILLDPDYGTPYNDIGSYFLELGRPYEAIPWLYRATSAKKYDEPQFAWRNLGQAYEMLFEFRLAESCYRQASCLHPALYGARHAAERLHKLSN